MYINVDSSGDALNLSNLLKDGDWMILYYAEWCGHCQTMKPEWNKVVKKLKKNNNNVNIAEIESNHIDNLVNKPTIQGFPTIKMYNNGKEVANFEDERVADKMENFALHNSNNSKKSKHIKHNVFKTLNTKTNTNNNINLLPNNNINLLPNNNINLLPNNNINLLPKNTNNSINKLNNTKPSVLNNINNKSKECKKYVIPKQCKSIPDCTFDYKIKKCIVKKPKTIKKIIEEQPMMNEPEPMMNEPEPMMNEPEPMMNEPEPMMNEPEHMMNEPEPVMNKKPKKTIKRKTSTSRTMKSKPIKHKTSTSRTMKSKPIKHKTPTSRTMKSKTVRRKTPTSRTMKSKTVRRKTPTSRTMKSKTVRRKTPTSKQKKNKNKQNYDLKKSTKSVFSKLINSFDRIGDEAKKDAELLTEARHLL